MCDGLFIAGKISQFVCTTCESNFSLDYCSRIPRVTLCMIYTPDVELGYTYTQVCQIYLNMITHQYHLNILL